MSDATAPASAPAPDAAAVQPAPSGGSSKKCRFYRQRFPNVEDVVMVNVLSIAEMGAYVRLLEYNGVEGMILLSELSRRRIRSINKLIRVGRNECVVVLRVDQDKGYIDLSKRRVAVEDVRRCEERYNKAKAVHSILSHFASENDLDLEDLYERTAWRLEDKLGGPGSSYDAIKKAITDKPDIFDDFDLDEDVKKKLITKFRQKLTPQPVKIRSDIEVACYAYEGVEAVKEALRAGMAVSSESLAVKISLIAPPLYTLSTVALDKEAGIAKLQESIDTIRKVISEKKGTITVQMEPRAVTESDDRELASMMEKYEKENTEIAGDDDSEGEVEESTA